MQGTMNTVSGDIWIPFATAAKRIATLFQLDCPTVSQINTEILWCLVWLQQQDGQFALLLFCTYDYEMITISNWSAQKSLSKYLMLHQQVTGAVQVVSGVRHGGQLFSLLHPHLQRTMPCKKSIIAHEITETTWTFLERFNAACSY